MKKYKFLLLTTCLFVANAAVAQNMKRFTVSYKNTPLHIVLKDIMKQTGMGYIIDSKCLDQSNTITLKADSVTIKEILKKICAENAIKYRLSDKIIFLASDPSPVRGRVVDQQGEPLAGVTVHAGHMSTLTNNNGTFYIRPDACDGIIKLFHSSDSAIVRIGRKKDITVQMRTAIATHIN